MYIVVMILWQNVDVNIIVDMHQYLSTKWVHIIGQATAFVYIFNPIVLRMAKTLWSFGHSECNRVNRFCLTCI